MSKSGLTPVRKSKIPRRNAKCPCGSGFKAKKCCLAKIKLFNSMSLEERQKFYINSLFVVNRIKEQIAKQQTKQRPIIASVDRQEVGEVTNISSDAKESSND
jgi:elongation factor P--beta-lysine ligase